MKGMVETFLGLLERFSGKKFLAVAVTIPVLILVGDHAMGIPTADLSDRHADILVALLYSLAITSGLFAIGQGIGDLGGSKGGTP